jgi:Spy/CpxP family protein refolding chaperone
LNFNHLEEGMKKKMFSGGIAIFVVSLFFAPLSQSQMMDSGGKGHGSMKGHEGMMGHGSKKDGHTMGMEGYGGRHGTPFDVDMFKERLQLTDEQMDKLRKLRTDYRKEMIKRKANLRIAELELWELMESKNIDMARTEKKVKDIGAMQADLMLYRIKVLQETRKFLSEEQYEQFRDLGFRSMQRMMGRHGMGGDMMEY